MSVFVMAIGKLIRSQNNLVHEKNAAGAIPSAELYVMMIVLM